MRTRACCIIVSFLALCNTLCKPLDFPHTLCQLVDRGGLQGGAVLQQMGVSAECWRACLNPAMDSIPWHNKNPHTA